MVARYSIISRKTIESTQVLENTQVHSHTMMKTTFTIIGATVVMAMDILLLVALICKMPTVMTEVIILMMISITVTKYTVCTDNEYEFYQ